MKGFLRSFIIISLILFTFSSLWAEGKKSIAIIPFTMDSEESLSYIKQGLWDMLTSRISATDKLEVVSKDRILIALNDMGNKDMVMADVYALGKTMNVDYVVFGSITKIGNSLSINGKLLDIASSKSSVNINVQSQGMDDVISKINDFAQKIDQNILGMVTPPDTSPLDTTPPPLLTPPSPVQEKSQRPFNESALISGIKKSKQGTLTSIINSDIINTVEPMLNVKPVLKEDFLMSQKFPTEFTGMDIGDVNKDGLNEVVVIDTQNVLIYQHKNNNFNLIQKITGKSTDHYLSVDVADINKNGFPEVIVTNLAGNTLESFILEFKDEKFIPIATKLPWFLRVIETPSGPVLLGQSKGLKNPFDTPVDQIAYDNGTYERGSKIKMPLGLSVYGLAITSLKSGESEKIIAVDASDYLNIYEKTDLPLSRLQSSGGHKVHIWKSADVYRGSNHYIEFIPQHGDPALSQLKLDETKKITSISINPRILTYDSDLDGKKRVLILKNSSPVGRFSKNDKFDSSGELYDLEWNGLGLFEYWKTKKISGYVADYQLKDIDNDGQKEIVLALVLSDGSTTGNTSVIVVYKMNLQQGS
jgi:TolB-like protein